MGLIGDFFKGAVSGLAGGLPGIASSVIGGLLGNSAQASANEANLQATRETNESNMQIHQMDNEFNAAEAQKARDWNTASAQRQRLEEAGYNPMTTGLNGEGSGSGVVASASPAQAMTTGAPAQPVDALGNSLTQASALIPQMTSALSQMFGAENERERVGIDKNRLEFDKSAYEDERQVRSATADYYTKLTELADEEITNQVFQRNIQQTQSELWQSQIKVNQQQTAYVMKQVENYAKEFALRWFQAKSERIQVNSYSANVNQIIRAFEADPNNRWFEGLNKQQKQVVYELLSRTYRESLVNEASQLRLQLNDAPWVDNAYYRLMKYVVNPATSNMPMIGVGSQSSQYDALNGRQIGSSMSKFNLKF